MRDVASVRSSEVYDVIDQLMPDGSSYTGQISKINNLKHGQGTQIWPDGARYTGSWRFGQANGFGIFYHVNGDTFEGNFSADKANGKGTYRHVSG
jgi:hypothetical protein